MKIYIDIYKNSNKVFEFLKYLSIISLIAKILNTPTPTYFTNIKYFQLISLVILLLFVGNNLIRDKYIGNYSKILTNISYIASLFFLGFLVYGYSSFGTAVYNVLLMIEVVNQRNKISYPLIILHGILFFVFNGLVNEVINGGNSYLFDADLTFSYIFTLIMVFMFKHVKENRDETIRLNKELSRAYLYEKELTIQKERYRIAQELHDSIGHSLIALKMNLEFAEQAFEINPTKTKEVIIKANSLSKECISTLREVVSILNEESNIDNLRDSLNELFEKFESTNNVNFNLDLYEYIDDLDVKIKDCIYKTVRESITNGIKHGNATMFKITVLSGLHDIRLSIYNNGISSNEVKKSNGVKGIENRISALGGRVDFKASPPKGFTVNATLPYIQ
ncbi:MAG: sensor histidine kinase [Clostridium sp.]